MIPPPLDSDRAGKKLLRLISSEFGPVMAYPQSGEHDCFIDGFRVKFSILSIDEACGYCGGPGVTGRGPDDYQNCPVCTPKPVKLEVKG